MQLKLLSRSGASSTQRSDQTSLSKAAPHAYKVGDRVFFSSGNHPVAGEGMFIGRLKASPDVLVLIVGKQAVETLENECAPTGGGFRTEGES